METLTIKLTSKEVMKQVDNLDHLFWDEPTNLEAQKVLENGIDICDNVLADLSEDDFAGYSYFRNSKYELTRYLNCIQQEHTPDSYLSREHPFTMPTIIKPFNGRIEPKTDNTPYHQPEPTLLTTDDESPNYAWLIFAVISIAAFCVALYNKS